jgi:hypothetical protein
MQCSCSHHRHCHTAQHARTMHNNVTPPELLKEYASPIESSPLLQSLWRPLQPVLLGPVAAHESSARAGLKFGLVVRLKLCPYSACALSSITPVTRKCSLSSASRCTRIEPGAACRQAPPTVGHEDQRPRLPRLELSSKGSLSHCLTVASSLDWSQTPATTLMGHHREDRELDFHKSVWQQQPAKAFCRHRCLPQLSLPTRLTQV